METAAVSAREPAPASLTIEWFSDPAQIESISEPWSALEATVRHRTHLSAFDFLAPWYRHYAAPTAEHR